MTCEKSLDDEIATAFEDGRLGVRAEAIAVAMTLGSRHPSESSEIQYNWLEFSGFQNNFQWLPSTSRPLNPAEYSMIDCTPVKFGGTIHQKTTDPGSINAWQY